MPQLLLDSQKKLFLDFQVEIICTMIQVIYQGVLATKSLEDTEFQFVYVRSFLSNKGFLKETKWYEIAFFELKGQYKGTPHGTYMISGQWDILLLT